eukprot:1939992-Prymnesium_polylepis.1
MAAGARALRMPVPRVHAIPATPLVVASVRAPVSHSPATYRTLVDVRTYVKPAIHPKCSFYRVSFILAEYYDLNIRPLLGLRPQYMAQITYAISYLHHIYTGKHVPHSVSSHRPWTMSAHFPAALPQRTSARQSCADGAHNGAHQPGRDLGRVAVGNQVAACLPFAKCEATASSAPSWLGRLSQLAVWGCCRALGFRFRQT